jgi:hypothetical protein
VAEAPQSTIVGSGPSRVVAFACVTAIVLLLATLVWGAYITTLPGLEPGIFARPFEITYFVWIGLEKVPATWIFLFTTPTPAGSHSCCW